MSAITTHVLDTSRGKPASGVQVVLERADGAGGWVRLGAASTDANGRIAEFTGAGPVTAGVHRLTFAVSAYFAALGVPAFFPTVQITFDVTRPAEHHHVPVLLSPFGYSTYRGS